MEQNGRTALLRLVLEGTVSDLSNQRFIRAGSVHFLTMKRRRWQLSRKVISTCC